MVILLLTASVSPVRASFYSSIAENLPEVGAEQTVYLGDRMIQQRFGYNIECLIPRQDLVFVSKKFPTMCLKSSKRFENITETQPVGVTQIEEGGLICPDFIDEIYVSFNFYSAQSKDGSIKEKLDWKLKETRTKKQLIPVKKYAKKLVDLPKAEFDQIFTPQEVHQLVEVITIKSGEKICKENPLSLYSTEGKALRDSSIKIQTYSPLSGDIEDGNKILQISSSLDKFELNNDKSVATEVSLNIGDKIKIEKYLQLGKSKDGDHVLQNMSYDEAFELASAYRIKDDKLQQTIEYAGRTGEILNFIYSEFSDGMARDAFTREFRMDLSEGNIGAYKGAIFEVIKATNATISYKVIRHFPEQ
tara:strand:- start:166 stop:1248 length:1083 start_codon:yes stop_codon:yes gene_type:complete